MLFEGEMLGVIMALLYASIGYAIAKTKHEEEFNPVKFFKTIFIGFVVSILTAKLGYTITELEGAGLVGFLTVMIDKVIGLIFPASTKQTVETVTTPNLKQ